MFSRAPRFPSKQLDNLPGPGEYDRKSPESRRKGAFLEKDERFKDYSDKHAADNFGMYGTADPALNAAKYRPRALSSSAGSDAKHRIESLKLQHEKEIKKLEAQLAKQTKKASHNDSSEKELDRLRKENKSLIAKEASVRSEVGYIENLIMESQRADHYHSKLAVAQQQLAIVPSLRSKFDALVSQHASSKDKHASTVTSFNKEIDLLKSKHKSECEEKERLKLESAAKTREVHRLEADIVRATKEKKSALDQLQLKEQQLDQRDLQVEELLEVLQDQSKAFSDAQSLSRTQMQTLCRQAHHDSERRRAEHTRRLADLQSDTLVAAYQNLRTGRKLAEKTDQIDELVELIMVLEEEKTDLQIQVDEMEEDITAHLSAAIGMERLLQTIRDEYEEQKEADQERIDSLMDNLAHTHQERAQEQAITLEQSYELELTNGELASANKEIDTRRKSQLILEEQLSATKDDLHAAHRMVSEGDEKIQTLSLELEEKALEVSRLDAEVVERSEAQRALEADLANEREQRRRLTSLLSQSQSTEEVLQQEITSLQHDLINYVQLQETNEELVKALDRVIRTSALAQEDADELGRLNAELTGHSNPSQKIRHLDRIRTELSNLKKAHISTQSELSSARRHIETLQTEIKAYKAVDSLPVLAKQHLQTSRLAKSVSTSILSDAKLPLAGRQFNTAAEGHHQRSSSQLKVPVAGQLRTRMSVSELR